MPPLPQVRNRARLPDAGYPVGVDYGRGFRQLGYAGEVFDRIQDAADTAEVSKLSSVAVAQMETALKETQDQFPDPDEFGSFAAGKIEEIHQNTLKQARNERVKQAVGDRLADNIVRAQGAVKHHTAQLRIGQAKADFEIVLDEAVKRRVEATDPMEQSRIDAQVSDDLNDLIRRGVFKPGEGTKKVLDYREKTLKKRADVMIRSNPASFLNAADKGEFKDLDRDTVYKFREAARKKMEDDDAARDKIFRDVKKVVADNVQAAANRGELLDSDLREMLDGRHPYITPQEAREIQKVNENPPSGEGSDSVRSIMQEYHSGPSSFGRINAARSALKEIARQTGKPNKLLDAAFGELQTDERTMTGIEASRVNRQIQAAQDEYDANTPPLPFNSPLFRNQRQQDKAKIGEAVRKGQDPKEAVKRKSQEMKNRLEAIPDSQKKVLDLTR